MHKINVAVPVPFDKPFIYLSKTDLSPGVRVLVPFGKRKLIGVVLGPGELDDDQSFELREIEECIDDNEMFSPIQMKLAKWLSSYYLFPLGEVLKGFLPTCEAKPGKIWDISIKSKGKVAHNPIDKASALSLNSEQSTSYSEISKSIQGNLSDTFLLHGVTGSGKTRVYLKAISKTLSASHDSQALVLVPEIALTPQMTKIFEEHFGSLVSVVHSGLSNRQRWVELMKIKRGESKILVGARSAIFAPFTKLSLIIVDEEHDQSYKQSSGLNYNARDVAVIRSKWEQATCILGSATPSLESFHNTKNGKYRYLELKQRAQKTPMPEIIPITVPAKNKQNTVKLDGSDEYLENCFSKESIEALRENTANGKQSIILVNRRGYSYFLYNHEEKSPVRCPHCSVSLTIHRKNTELLCHYCGYKDSVARIQAESPRTDLTPVGVGSQQAELLLKQLLPDARVARLDSDISSSRKRLIEVLQDFREGKTDILVGTQILAKGHDFPNVSLTVIAELDNLFGLPDIRAGERVFQLAVQAAGRSGRAGEKGRVLLQSSKFDHPVLEKALTHDYQGFAELELSMRRDLQFPPYGHLIQIEMSSLNEKELEDLCAKVVTWQRHWIRTDLTKHIKVIGPTAPPLERINKRFRRVMTFSSTSMEIIHPLARQFMSEFSQRGRGLRVQVDVDPLNLF